MGNIGRLAAEKDGVRPQILVYSTRRAWAKVGRRRYFCYGRPSRPPLLAKGLAGQRRSHRSRWATRPAC